MCELVLWIEKRLHYSQMGTKQARLLSMAGKCCGLRILIFLAYADDAQEILRKMREMLEKRLE